jgi:hypothetical protein
VTSDVARNFASTGGVTDQSNVLEIKRFNNSCQIVGVSVHIIPGPGLAGPTMATPVVRNHSETILGKEMELAVPCIGI